MEIMELAAQLGQAIKADERIAKMEEARVAYEKDEEIQKLMLEYNAQQIAMAEEYKKDPVDQQIIEAIDSLLSPKQTLSGKRMMITAGATIEAIDPVRYISNHSTGKMGYAIANALAKRGAEVVLVSGKTALQTPQGVRRVDVCSAEDMYNAAVVEFEQSDCAVMCAAVADYTPVEVATNKIKKSDDSFSLELRKTKDIAFELGKVKGNRKIVGFALETNNEQANAEEKLRKKNLDLIVLNSLRDEGAGFGCDTNKVCFIDALHREELPLLSKSEVAERIADKIEKLFF